MAESRHSLFRQFAASDWNGFLKGVEKEGLRVDRNGFIAQTPHPDALGSALTHPSITTDYSEALLELITPVCSSTAEMLESLRNTHRFVQQNLGDEVFWPASMPCELNGDASIPIAEYGSSNTGRLKHVYRQGLAVRYGRMMQSIAGAHYNLSLPDSFWSIWQSALGDQQSMKDFKSEQYFWLIRNFRRRSWLLMLLFGASPALDASFVDGVRHDLGRFDERSWFGQYATSLRMSDLGYHNNAQSSLNICFNKLSTYTQTLDRAIHTNWPPYEALGTKRDGQFIQINTSVLQIENEYYSAVRPKRTAQSGEKPIHALQSRGVEYIEVRCLDLDPFSAVGVSEAQVDFLDLFLLDCLLSDSPRIDDAECGMLDDNYKDVVAKGRNRELTLCQGGERTPVGDAATAILDRLEPLAELLDGWNGGDVYRKALAAQQGVLSGDRQVCSARVIDAMQSAGLGHRDWTMEMALAHQNALRKEGMDAGVEAAYVEATRDSLAEQKRIEDSDTQEFGDFLEQYLRS
ncbi:MULTISPECIES: glutamate--cysteine ligase [unclassified Marinobacter]|uniref:glutamate--cysteine ligase n=1 Tax=unclassified Marinobacter TaxID=83889 RepID=UPI0026E44D46|nr:MULTISPECIES: glutamate--cysteine ligase [unclassified Marinobacter]MDO6443477.1 glutamate--cysteine ligase [Marinobacter sp. 2_MG-2023]MDO6824138.1 glutamate--cysteine ligase [Marinobacter sp. 1_MG-2023]